MFFALSFRLHVCPSEVPVDLTAVLASGLEDSGPATFHALRLR